MRIMAMAAMAMAVGMSSRAEQTLTVYLQEVSDVPSPVLIRAEGVAAEIFASVGVRIEWRKGRPDTSHLGRAIVANMAIDTPRAFLPGAFAFARVYEGVHITVFWDRIKQKANSLTAGVVLGHVLAHEITHIVQRVDRHSESGVMKERWTGEDYSQMTWKPLPFTPEDANLIQQALAKRDGDTLLAANSHR